MKQSALREADALDRLAHENLSGTDLEQWNNIGSGHRFTATVGKKLVVYTLGPKGKAEILHKLKCYDLGALSDNIWSSWDVDGDYVITVSHAPMPVIPGVFLGHTIYSAMDLVPSGSGSTLRFSMYYKTLFNPKSGMLGVNYILEKAVFDQLYPNAA